jgi:hypothetical protein
MDHLPKTLLCLMNTVVEQYIEFSWASQEQNGKMKITLTWTNVEMKRNKSKATRKRDRKRHEQYIINVSWNPSVVLITILEKNRLLLLGISLTCVLGLTHSVRILSCTLNGCTTFCIDKETEIKETNTNNVEYSSSEDDSDSTDSEMDTIQNIITPCSTPSQVNPSVVFITILEKNRLLLLGRSLTCVLGLTHSVCILSCTLNGCTTFYRKITKNTKSDCSHYFQKYN